MELLLTDRLACPRCGPEFGLILRADRMVDRRVSAGVIGCPNCRDSFSVDGGVVDLRPPPRGPLPDEAAPSVTPASPNYTPDRVMALLGIQRGPGTVALIGAAAAVAETLAAAVDELQVAALGVDVRPVVVGRDGRPSGDTPGVSRLVVGNTLPFFSRMLRGVVLDGRLDAVLVGEAARVVGPGSRVIVVDAVAGTGGVLEEAGCTVLAEEAGTIVAARS